jgi:cell division initiation protein
MKLTPLDIRHKDFKRGMRGYVDAEVDEFLDEVADEFERLFKENIDLAERCETLQEKIDHYRTLEETLQKTLVSAQRSAEELKTNAQKEAQLILSEAELKARQMVNESYADKQAIEKNIVVLKSSEEDFRFKFRSLLEGYAKQLDDIDAAAKKGDQFKGAAEELQRTMAADEAARAKAGAPATPRPPAAPEARPAQPAPPTPSAPEQPADKGAAAAEPPKVKPAGPAPVPDRAPRPAEPVTVAPREAEAGDKPARDAPLGEPDDLLADVEDEVDDNEFKW